MDVRIMEHAVGLGILDDVLDTATNKGDPALLDLETINNIEWKYKKADRFVQVLCTYDEIQNDLLFPAYVHAIGRHHHFFLMCFLSRNMPVEILYCLEQAKKIAASTVVVPKSKMGNKVLVLIGLYPESEGTDIDALISKLF